VDQRRQAGHELDAPVVPSPSGEHRLWVNEVRLELSVPACKLGNLQPRVGLPQRIKSAALASFERRLM